MPLCGGFRCGCGVTSTPATQGAVNGELPSIVVSGSGEPGDPFDLTLNDAWAVEVAGTLSTVTQLSNVPLRIQRGSVTTAPNASGVFSVTFPEPFASSPTVMLEMLVVTSANEYTVFATAVSATGFSARQHFNGTGYNQPRTCQWVAFGTPT